MVDVNYMNTYFKSIVTRLQADGIVINNCFLVRSESELAGDIKALPAKEFFLAVLIPSSDTKDWNIDAITELEGWLIYVLEKSDRKGITHDNRITSVALQQLIITKVKEMLRDDIQDRTIPYHIDVQFDTMHTDPEDNFHGCEGYSLSFKVKSNDFYATKYIAPPIPEIPDGAILTEDGLNYLITEDGLHSLQYET